MTNLRIGIPSKGRLSTLATDLLNQAGLKFRRQDRSLFARVQDMPIDVTFLRTDDIPILCQEGAIDAGITGSDLIAEGGADVDVLLPLGVGRCRLAVCVPEASTMASASDLAGKNIATSFPTITNDYLTSKRVTAHTVELSGSVEVMVALGIADAITDIVETGSTLAANKLRILETMGAYETVLLANKTSAHGELLEKIRRRLEGVVIAKSYSLLEYNIRRDRLAEAESIAPGFDSPTIASLEDPAMCSVKVMVRSSDAIDQMEKLEAVGASAILMTDIVNCRL